MRQTSTRDCQGAPFQPLSGMDAGFLYMETATAHMHTLKVAIMRPLHDTAAPDFAGFRRALERKIVLLPSFTKRIMEVPFGLGHPVWVSDPDFDIARHLAHRTAPAPGGMQELNGIVSEVASRPLQRDRPLWEITMVDGLEGGHIAFVCKLHHAMADGAAALGMLLEVVVRPTVRKGSDSDGNAAHGRGDAPIATAPVPSEWALRRFAIRQGLRRVAALPKLLLRTLHGVYQLVARRVAGAHTRLPAHFSGPRTAFSGALTPRRSLATTRVPLADLKRVKSVLGVTVNDVFLGLCGGALRTYLDDVEGGIPPTSLLASVPVNTDPDGPRRTQGNRVGNLSVSICTHIADPVERVRAIHEMTDEAKQRHRALGSDLLERWSEYAPPEPYRVFSRFWSTHRMADRVHPPVNLIASNVPGPRSTIEVGGLRLEALYSVGPILQGIGLNLTGWSCMDDVCIVGLACPDQIEDVQALVDRLPVVLEELVLACETHVGSDETTDGRPVDAGAADLDRAGEPARRSASVGSGRWG